MAVKFSFSILLLPGFLVGCGEQKYGVIYHSNDNQGFLKIERIVADGRVGCGPITLDCGDGKTKQFRQVQGDSSFVFGEMFAATPFRRRVVVETSNPSYYRITYDSDDSSGRAAHKAAEILNFKIVQERRKRPAYIVAINTEKPVGLTRFDGDRNLPIVENQEIKQVFNAAQLKPGDGRIRHVLEKAETDTINCEGITFAELAQYFDRRMKGCPVVDSTGDANCYSFNFPKYIWKQFALSKSVAIPTLGVSVTGGEADVDVVAVYDGDAKKP